jgi:type IV pilus assembly protein PilW
MITHTKGFGLVEIMLALLISLVMSLALAQVFTTAKSTNLSQNASASLQEDARFVLAKMVREIRLAGMFGCLGRVQDSSVGGGFSNAFNAPVQWDARQKSLTVMTAPVGADSPWHEWIVHTDCLTSATAWSRGHAPSLQAGEIALPVQRHVYRLNEQRHELTLDGQPLLSNIRAFSVLFGVADSASEPGIARYTHQPDPARIRSVRLTLTLFDPADRKQEQTFNLVAAIRNRLG